MIWTKRKLCLKNGTCNQLTSSWLGSKHNFLNRLDQGRYKGLDEIYYWVSENAWYPLVMALVTQGIIWTTIGMLVVSPVIIAAKPGLFEFQTFALVFIEDKNRYSHYQKLNPVPVQTRLNNGQERFSKNTKAKYSLILIIFLLDDR